MRDGTCEEKGRGAECVSQVTLAVSVLYPVCVTYVYAASAPKLQTQIELLRDKAATFRLEKFGGNGVEVSTRVFLCCSLEAL